MAVAVAVAVAGYQAATVYCWHRVDAEIDCGHVAAAVHCGHAAAAVHWGHDAVHWGHAAVH